MTQSERTSPPWTLEERFHAAMLHLYYTCAARLKPPYFAARFLELVHACGGKQAADQLLAGTSPSAGFIELALRGPGHLTLSVEYLCLQSPWRALFDEEQRAVARARLAQAGCTPPAEDDAAVAADPFGEAPCTAAGATTGAC